jgi:sulfur-carrier protein
LRRGGALSRVRIPPTLRTETEGAREIEASGRTVRELLDDLMGRFPALRGQLLEDEDLAPFVNVYVEGEDVRTREGLETPVDESSTIILLPAMAGGAAAEGAMAEAAMPGVRPRTWPKRT